MLGELIPTGGGDLIPLIREKLVVGRRDECDIRLRFPNISSKHCQLEFRDGYWRVTDLGSTNGLKVNGVRCQSKWLMPGDLLTIARHHFKVNYTPTGNGPPPEDDDNPFEQSLLERAGLQKPRPKRSPDRPGDQS